MSRFVLDNTIAMAWCFTDEASELTENLLDRLATLEGLTALPIEIDYPAQEQVFTSVRLLARQHVLTAYDAAYLELAIRYNIPIASSDGALVHLLRA